MKIKDIIQELQTLDQEKELKWLYDSFETYEFNIEEVEQQEKEHNSQFKRWNKGDYLIRIG